MKIIGHRGARGLAPENTMASLKKGLEHDADMLEFDLRVTRDGVVILHHDPELSEPNGAKHLISALSYAELRAYKPDLTTFQEVMSSFAGKVILYIEVKPQVPVKPIVKIIEKFIKTGVRPEQLLVGSFSQKILLEFQEALPKVPKVVIEKWSGVRARLRARQLGTKLLCMNQRWLWWGFIRGFKGSGWQLYAYTLNDPVKAKRWAGYGLAGVVTDYPDRFENKL